MADSPATTDAALRIRAQHLSLFGTQVIHGNVPDSAALNAALAATIQEKRNTDEGIARSNVGSWHSATDMLAWGGDAAAKVSDLAMRAAKRLSHFDGHDPASLDWSVRMWANVTPPGGLNMSHAHPGVLWAAAYYVDDGCADGEAEGGDLILEDPRFPVPFLTFPGFRAVAPDGQPQTGEHRVRPVAGDLVLFPGYLRHSVRPHLGSRERVSIAMNIYVKSRAG